MEKCRKSQKTGQSRFIKKKKFGNQNTEIFKMVDTKKATLAASR